MIMISGIRLVITSLSHITGKRDKNSEEMIISKIYEIDSNVKVRNIVVHNYGAEAIWADLVLSVEDKTQIPIIQQI